ncbi:Maltose operon transcriptional repressor MalR, LacI family [Streptococcus sp. DD10]|uniref:LacI family DNA-binding transcriptional regulator n=1 Tax=Streptococcus sp. DD10 TaxID=1777878 RepID=UPI00079CB338|nr:LacI family DNA-binding transcriptional regulator [Streptococcus sp. DD10]KXT74351.1 Maltose operon transcriptional repressor MalR, LacI family [Streptococcus sp. DD10]
MRATIKEVAKLAGVSPSTVTRVVQDKSTISDETKQKVRAAMKALDYHPNLNARSLVSQFTQVIGLVLPDDSDVFYQNPFFPTVLRGISQVAADSDYAIQISTGKDEEGRLNAVKQMIYGKRVDGLIFLYSKPNDPLVQFAIDNDFPFLILGKAVSPFVSLVDNDNIQGGQDATNYFIKKGYKNIGFLAGNKELVVSQDRFQGYKKALHEANIPYNEKLVKFSFGFLLEDTSYKSMEKLPIENMEAIVTSDSLVAEGVLQYLTEKQIHLPVISFDSIKPRLPLTAYIDINALELGKESFRTLQQIISDQKKNQIICYRKLIPHSIITH